MKFALPSLLAVLVPLVSGSVPARAADGRGCAAMRACSAAIETAETLNLDSCLAGKPVEFSASVKGALDIVKKALNGDIKVEFDHAAKASSKLSDELQRPENDEVRKCLGDLKEIVNSCLKDAIKMCLSSTDYPAGVDFLFSMKFKDKDSALYVGDKLAVGYRQPARSRNPTTHDPDNEGWYSTRIDMHVPDGRFQAAVTRVPRSAFDPALKGHVLETPICLEWVPSAPAGQPADEAYYRCAEGDPAGSCAADAKDLGWLRKCPDPSRSGQIWPALIPAAYAESAPAPAWIAPSLDTLRGLQESYVVGFVQFAIHGTGTNGIEADAVTYRVYVNGRELLIDGLRSDYRAQQFAPGGDIDLAFGVQSLNMDGRIGGCDRLDVEIEYLKGGKSAATHKLTQTFAAMRHPEPARREFGGTSYSVTGEYKRPDKEPDTEVFVVSTDPSNFVPELLSRMRERIEGAKGAFDKAGIVFEGKRLLGVIRPPLTNGSFGLVAGAVEDTGQVQFVFPKASAMKLQDFLHNARQSSPAVRAAVAEKTFLYSPRTQSNRPNVCPES